MTGKDANRKEAIKSLKDKWEEKERKERTEEGMKGGGRGGKSGGREEVEGDGVRGGRGEGEKTKGKEIREHQKRYKEKVCLYLFCSRIR